MRPGAIKIETNGSLWWFDETAHQYMRLPKNELPRERAEWSDERAGVLQDAVWHPYIDYWVVTDRAFVNGLFIGHPDGRTSYAPITEGVCNP